MTVTVTVTEDFLKKALKDHFDLESFRPGQMEIISSVFKGCDTVAVMPTGGGKSLCFQLPATVQTGLTIVVSPLIALMNDQVQALKARGIPAGCLHSNQSYAEKKEIFSRMSQSDRFILYLSPERVQKDGFSPWLQNQRVALFAIDEAHCISQWGHDFRKEYGELSQLKVWRPDVPVLALTATATPTVIRDIVNCLGIPKADRHVYGFYRPNLYYQVQFCSDEEEKRKYLFQGLRQFPKGRVIIYCGTRKGTESWAALMMQEGESVAYYHAGLTADERTKIEHSFLQGEVRVLVATNAFGMGVDLPDVRLIIHTEMPGNLESYYQEVGRAGRDGDESTCLLLYAKKDKGLQAFFIEKAEVSQTIKRQRWQSLNAMIQFAEGGGCRHGGILTYFRDKQRISRCGHCDACTPNSTRKIQEVAHSSSKVRLRKSTARSKDSFEIHEPDPTREPESWRIEVLKEWRREYAARNDIPPFLVFSDKTLRDLATQMPKTVEDLQKIYGLAEKKIARFGKELLEVLNA